MSDGGDVLSAVAGRDEERLRSFLETRISPNAWPVHSPVLRRAIYENGVDLVAARRFTMDIDAMENLIRHFYVRMRRIERTLRIQNAFHGALHNHEVLLRLLLIEWPDDLPVPDEIDAAVTRVYRTIDEIVPVLRMALTALLDGNVASHLLARDLLSALGHDYGHSGGSERRNASGTPTLFTHEEMAERHVAPIGLAFGMPVALVVESIAAIRATTFHSRPGREKIQVVTEFERRLKVADVMGCVLPPDQWLLHVGVPVLMEKLPDWRKRLAEIPLERQRISDLLARSDLNEAERDGLEAEREVIDREDSAIVKDIGEWFRSELGFFRFIQSNYLSAAPRAGDLWGEILRKKVALVERVLGRPELLEPLTEKGFPMLECWANALGNAHDLGAFLTDESLDPRLREILSMFLPWSESFPRLKQPHVT